jgi:single-strand DNA-binding protein
MSGVNKAIVLGRLGEDPKLSYTPSQQPVANMSIATSEVWEKNGQKQENTQWHRVIVWGKQAENCHKYLTKGAMVYVEGRMETRKWTDKNGVERFTTEIIASNVQFTGSAEKREKPPTPSDPGNFRPNTEAKRELAPMMEEDIPF